MHRLPSLLNAGSGAPALPLLRLLLLPALVAGCSYFPSHEEVYIPIPLQVGEQRIENGDTVYVLESTGYRLIAPRQQVLADARTDLDAAVRQFERIFGISPDTVTIRYVDTLEMRNPGEREGQELSGARLLEGDLVLPTRPDVRARRGQVPPPRASPAAARRWMRSHARRIRGDPEASTGAGDSLRAPAWLMTGLADVIAYGVTTRGAQRQLWERRSEIIPLEELFALPTFMEGDPTRRLGRGQLERLTIRRFQASSFASFVADREEPRFLGEFADRILAGRSVSEALRGAENLPTDVAELDRRWRDWVEAMATGR